MFVRAPATASEGGSKGEGPSAGGASAAYSVPVDSSGR